jgi:hypothetical protein
MAYTVQSSAAALNRAFNNANATPTAFAATVADLTAGTQAAANKFDDGTLSDLALSTKVLTNMGILPSTVPEVMALEAALADYFATTGKGNRGFVVLQLSEAVSAITETTNPLYVYYGAAAVAWNTEVAAQVTDATGVAYTLTTSSDTIAAGSAADTITGILTTLSSTGTFQVTDKIDGGAGDDSISLSLATDWTGFTTGNLANVETVNITNAGVGDRSINAAGITGVSSYVINANDAGVTLTNVAAIPAVTLTNQNALAADTFSLSFAAAAAPITGTADAITLNLSDVGRAAVAATTTTAAVAVQPSTITLNSIETANIVTSGTSVDIALTTSADLTKLNVSGSGATTIANTGTKLTSYDASGSTGAVTTVISDGTDGNLSSIKGGSGVDKITVTTADLVGNAVIAGGDGADTLTLSGAGATLQLQMSEVETLALAATSAMTFSGAKTTGLTTVSTTSSNTAAVTMLSMGSGALEFKASGDTVDAGDITTDSTGAVTVTYSASAAQLLAATTSAAPSADYTAASAAGVATVNVNAFVDTSNSTVTTASASSLVVNTTSGKTADVTPVEKTILGGTITAAAAKSIDVNSAGLIGGSSAFTTISAAAATKADVQSTGAAYLILTAAKLEELIITAGSTFSTTGSTFTKLQVASADVAKNTLTLPALPAISSLTVTGAGETVGSLSTASIGNLGASTNDYGLTLKASGLKGGLTVGTVNTGAGNAINVDISGVTGAATSTAQLGAIGDSAVGNVTVNAAGVTGIVQLGTVTAAGNIGITASPTKTFTVGTISGSTTGDVTLSLDNTLGVATIGTIAGKSVTVDASDTLAGLVGPSTTVNGTTTTANTFDVTAMTAANVAVSSLQAGAVKVTAATGSTALTVALTGGSLADQVQIADVATVASIVVTGDLGTGTDNIAFTSQWATSTANQTFSISGLTYDTSTLTGNSYGNTFTGGAGVDTISAGDGADVISGGAGADIITGGLGADTMTGGAGSDVYFFDDGDSTASAYDTITDLGTTDIIKVTVDGSNVIIVEAGNETASTSAPGITDGVASFTSITDQTTVDTVPEKATALAAIMSNNETVLFVHGSDTFMFIETASDDLVIKLTGVTVSQAGTPSDNGVTTGLTGFGA